MIGTTTPLREAMGMCAGTLIVRCFTAEVYAGNEVVWSSPDGALTYQRALVMFANPLANGAVLVPARSEFDLSDPQQRAAARTFALQIAQAAPECAR